MSPVELAPIRIDPASARFAVLAGAIRDAGLLNRRAGYYGITIPATLAAFAAGWVALFMVGNSWTALCVAVFLGVMFTRLGFICHDAGHQEVFRARRANRLLGLSVGNGLIGLSFGWWVSKHNAHHARPNEIGRDPDLVMRRSDLTQSDALSEGHHGPRRRRPEAAWLFFPLMLLRSTGLHLSGAQYLIRQRDREALVEGLLIAIHAVLYFTAIFWVLSPLKALVFIAVQQGVFSLYLGCSFAPNHKGMPILEQEIQISFFRRQVVTSRNISGGPFMTFMFGGLNYQIEHHLFPAMPRANLARAKAIVRQYCLESDLGYREERLISSFHQTMQYLSGYGALPMRTLT
jgi:fatty acid desaturase